MSYFDGINKIQLSAREVDKPKKPGFAKGMRRSPMMEFSAKLSWMQLQLRGARSNLDHQLQVIRESEMAPKLRAGDVERLKVITANIDTITKLLHQSEEEVAEFNKTKKQRTV